jgi:Ca2+-binding RTX toxin-like protein
MATINHSSGADIIVPNNNGTTYRGLGGDDTYILSNSIAANAAITIVDTSGSNKIQLVDGLSVASTKFAADAVQLTLTNGAVVTINGASNFDFDLGGNSTAGTSGTVKDFAGFASDAGVSTLPVSGSVAGASNVSVSGAAWSSGGSASYTVTSSGTKVTEGNDVTFTITSNTAVSADTTFSWTVIGDTNGGTVDKAGSSDIDVLSGTATIASGSTSTTFNVTPTTDSVVEGIEGIKVSVFDASSNAISSSKILVDNGGSSATSASFVLTTGVDTFTGRSGNDSFDATTLASLNDYDIIDGGDGVDTITVNIAAAASGTTIIPQLSNLENIQMTNSTAVEGSIIADDDILTIATAGLTGIQSVTNIAGVDAVTFADLANTVDVTIKSAPNDTELNFNATALTGASDSITATLSGTAASDLVITDDSVSTGSVLESLTINSVSVANTLGDLDTTGVLLPKLNITGSTKLTITAALDSEIATIDASGSTGGFTLTNAPAATVLSVTGSPKADTLTALAAGTASLSMGGGNDTVNFVATWTGADTYDGGDGVDTLGVAAALSNAGASSTVFGGLSNVEVLAVTTAVSLTLEADTVFSIIDISGAADQTVNFNDGYTQATTVKLGDDVTDNINNNSNIDLTVQTNSGGFTAATDIVGSTGTNDTLNIVNIASGDTIFDTNNDVFETINLVPFGATAAPTITLTDYSLALGTGVVTINAAGLTAANVVTLVGNASATPINMTSGAASDSITLGTKSDVLDSGAGNDIIVATAGSNTIDAGAGNDTITLGTGADNISGGAGNDTFTGGANLANTDIIDGGVGTDTLTSTGDITSASVMGGVSNIEVIDAAGTADITATGPMGGATTFLINDAGAQILTLGGAGLVWTPATTVSVTAGTETNNKKIGNSANVDLTVKALAADVDAAFTITGGTGTDILEITAGGTADLDATTKVETVMVKDSLTAGSDVTITVNENITTATETSVTYDASELDGSTTTAADERLTLTGNAAVISVNAIGGGGADSIDGGTKNDTIDGGAGHDTIDGNAGLDVLSGGAGNDIFTLNSLTDYSTAYGTDIIDGGAGVDSVTFTGAQNLTAANLSTISNTENWTIPAGSDFTISDAILASNSGLKFNFAGAGTLSTGEDSLGKSLMSTSLDIKSTATGAVKLIGSSSADTFTFQQTEELDASDTIDGNGGIDIIYIENDDDAIPNGVGEATTAALSANITNVEKLVVTDLGLDDNIGNVTITLAAGMTQTAFEVDGSALDANVTTLANGEKLTVTNSDDLKLTAHGGSFGDSLTGGSGADILNGNGGIDTLVGADGDDVISGGAGADIITGGAGTDSLSGGAGNDVFKVATFVNFKVAGGVETVDGGLGTDTLEFNEVAALVLTAPELSKLYSIEKITMAANTANLTFGNETFTNLGNDTLQITTTTHNSVTTIDGSAVSNGNFLIVDNGLNANSDKLVGGSGDDIFRFAGGTTLGLTDGDTITGGLGSDTIQIDNAAAVTAVIDFDTVTGIETISAYTSAATSLTDGALIIGIIKNNTAALNVGAITVDLSAKNVGTTTFNVASSVDDVNIDFTIIGGTTSDQIIGSLGDDTISGGGTIVGDTLTGGSGNDSISGNSGADTLSGGVGNDEVIGNAGNDIINGGSGNDILNGGAGTDTIEGDAGVDIITGGAGNDVFKYDVISDSSGNTKDTITDFKQSTLNAATGAQITNGDSISLVVSSGAVANGNTQSFILSDKGDVANAGEAVNSMNNSSGSFVFAKDNDVLYIDMDGDSTLNTDDYAFTLTGLDSFHGVDIDVTVSGDNDTITTITTLDGNDIITTGSAADIINSGGGNDTIVAGGDANIINSGSGNDIITGGAAIDTINAGSGNDIIKSGAGADIVTLGTGDDNVEAHGIVAANKTLIQDFEDAGATIGDVVSLLAAGSEGTNAAGNAPRMVSVAVADGLADGATYNLAAATGSIEGASLAAFNTGTTAGIDIVELTGWNTAKGNLATDFTAGNGTELLKGLVSGSGTAASITSDGANDIYYLIAYDTNVTVIYHVDGTANPNVLGDILPIAMFNATIADGAFVTADFLMTS